MAWNEQDHPRREDGTFTFKNGGANYNLPGLGGQESSYDNPPFKLNAQEDSSAQTLFKDTRIQKEIEEQKQKRRDELLNILGNKATQGDIFYGSEESLKKKIKELGLQPFSQDKEQHEVLRQLSVYCYDNGHQNIPKGYERVGHFESKNNGFDAVIVKNDAKKEIVIAYRGMEPLKDIPSTLRAGVFNYTSQQKSAQSVYEKIKQDPGFKGYEIQTTGQSLGGYLAQYVAAKNNLKSATFNAYHGTKEALNEEAYKNFQNFEIHPDNIVNYRNKEDFWTNKAHDNDIGTSLETNAVIKRNADCLQKYHVSENMGNLENARIKNENYTTHTTAKGRPIDIAIAKTRNFAHDKLNRKQN